MRAKECPLQLVDVYDREVAHTSVLNCLLEVSMCFVSIWMTGDHRIVSHVLLPLSKNTTYVYCPRAKPEPLILLGCGFKSQFPGSLLKNKVDCLWQCSGLLWHLHGTEEFSVIFVALILSGPDLPFKLMRGRKLLTKSVELCSDIENCPKRKSTA